MRLMVTMGMKKMKMRTWRGMEISTLKVFRRKMRRTEVFFILTMVRINFSLIPVMAIILSGRSWSLG